MSSRFSPTPMPPSAIVTPFPTAIDVAPPPAGTTRRTPSPAEINFGFGEPEGRAWSLLLLRAAYLGNFDFTVQAANFREGLIQAQRLEGGGFGQWKVTLLEYEPAILLVFHGVPNTTAGQDALSDIVTPRLGAAPFPFFRSAALVGDAVLSVINAGRLSDKPVAACAHSWGGIIGAYTLARCLAGPHAIMGLQTFGTPKIGQSQAQVSASVFNQWVYGAQDDPYIGLPPSYIRLLDVPTLVAVWPLPFLAASVVKAQMDALWSSYVSLTQTPLAIFDDGSMVRMANVDSGRNWYSRCGPLISSVWTWPSSLSITGHMARTYYNRCRAQFVNWSTLGPSAGIGGRNADVLALAISAAEALGG